MKSLMIILVLSIVAIAASCGPDTKRIWIEDGAVMTNGTWVGFNIHMKAPAGVTLETDPSLWCVVSKRADGFIEGCMALPFAERTGGPLAIIRGCGAVSLVVDNGANPEINDTYLVEWDDYYGALRQDNWVSTRRVTIKCPPPS